MSEYKRLTERDEFNNAEVIGCDSTRWGGELSFDELNAMTNALNRLMLLEDKIEDGRLVFVEPKADNKFSFKLGDKVFLIYKRYWNVSDKNGFWVLRESNVSQHNKKRFSDDFGKFVFLTREAAEARLKELEGKWK